MVFKVISEASGIGENVLRLLFTVLLGYPVAYIYKLRFLNPIETFSELDAAHLRNNYIVVTGLLLSFLFNGRDIIHSLLTVAGTYAICVVIGNFLKNRFLAAALIFIFNMGYLFAGYIAYSEQEYDLTWTMPQCVLCLRMIGFGMDFYDGTATSNSEQTTKKNVTNNSGEKSTKESTRVATPAAAPKIKPPASFSGNTSLLELPRFLHFVGYSYFFSAFLVGPQFSFTLYRNFIEGKTLPVNAAGKGPEGSAQAATACFLKGLFYLILQQILDSYFPSSYLLTSKFADLSFLRKLVIIWFTGRALINKYLGIWALNEGSCILSGISFNGYDAQGNAEWNGLTNIDTYSFETASSLNQIVSCFNINTNFWVKQYIFKRLMFLKSKELSQVGSLFFLALWHGFHSGYFVCFLLEFMDMWVERRITAIVAPYTQWMYTKKSPLRFLLNFICCLYTSSALLYAMIAFGLLRFPLYMKVYSTVYFIGHVVVVGLGIISLVIPRPSSKQRKPATVAETDMSKKSQ